MASDHDRLVSLLRAAHRILVFTGAGISTGSGIRDYRGPSGVWKTRQPVYFDEFLASHAKRVEYWEFVLEAFDSFRSARPNATHVAIAELERMGRIGAVVTQNIDGLHQDGGSSPDKVIEMHGTNRWIDCLDCGKRNAPAPIMELFRDSGAPPACECGGWLKPATISFGQSLRPEVLNRAAEEAASADLALSLGSTLSVNPAASMPLISVRGGAPYVVINRGPTEHDTIADLRIEGDVGEVLPEAVASL
jgi:NAD-dependent deacetylase